MCTAFAIRGRDVICGFNLDLPDGAWTWKVHAEPDSFYVTSSNHSPGCSPQRNAGRRASTRTAISP